MIAYYAWTNTQIINAANSRINIFKNDDADLYVRMCEQISESLLEAVEASGIFNNIYYFDPIILSYKKLHLGFLPYFRILFRQHAYKKAYSAMLENMCGFKKYNRVVLTWFSADSVFLLYHWEKVSPHLKISFLEEGTGGYCCHKKEMIFFLASLKTFKEKLKKVIVEGSLAYKYARNIDSICLHRPEYCREDIDWLKYSIPVISKETNPIMYQILCDSTSKLEYSHFVRYDKSNVYYFSAYSQEGKDFYNRSFKIIGTAFSVAGKRLLIKVHSNSLGHARTFAESLENLVFVDREKYFFEGLYMQILNRENKILISVASTTAIYPKFMFNEEPYIILTCRLYDTYRQLGVERDDRIVEILKDSYSDKSRIMVPNSMYEFRKMLAFVLGKGDEKILDTHLIDNDINIAGEIIDNNFIREEGLTGD